MNSDSRSGAVSAAQNKEISGSSGAAARTGEGDDLWEVEEAVVEQERKWYHTAYFVNENTKSVVSFVNRNTKGS